MLDVPFNRLYDPLYDEEDFLIDMANIFKRSNFLYGTHNNNLIEKIKDYLKTEYFLPLSSGTSALSIAIKSLGMSDGKKLLIAANAGGYGRIAADIAQVSIEYLDCDSNGLFSSEHLISRLQDDIGAVLITHLYGQMTDLKDISEICKRKNIPIIEDCAQSFGARRGSHLAGTIGDIGVFSFYPTKNLGAAGDAGGICTNNFELYKEAQRLSQYGWNHKYHIEISGGENSRMDEIQAYVLLRKLDSVDSLNIKRKNIWKSYFDAIKNSKLRLIGSEEESFVAHLAVIDTGGYRNSLLAFLDEHRIATAIHYPIIDTNQTAYSEVRSDLANATYLSNNCISIPLFPTMTIEEVDYVCEKLRIFVNNLEKI